MLHVTRYLLLVVDGKYLLEGNLGFYEGEYLVTQFQGRSYIVLNLVPECFISWNCRLDYRGEEGSDDR